MNLPHLVKNAIGKYLPQAGIIALALITGCDKDSLASRIKQAYREVEAAVVLHSIPEEKMIENDFLAREAANYAEQTGDCAIVVEKVIRKMSVYCGDRLEDFFDIELGRNPYEDKMREGDNATPEGWHAIAEIRDRPNHRFYHAFVLDYPTPRDEQKFAEAKRNGVLDDDDKIGGGVQIHGGGGRGYDFTAGCVALRNTDIDTLMRYAHEGRISVGTPIVVVKATSDSL